MKRTFLPVLFVSVLLGTACANAALVTEDFSYTVPTNMNSNPNGGTGWSGGWGTGGGGTTSTLTISGSNLTYSGGSYNIVQTGVGHPTGGNNPDFRGMNRNVAAPFTGGTVWFSVLLQNGGSGSHSGVQFNHSTSGVDYNPSNYFIDLAGSDLDVQYNGTLAPDVATGLSTGQAHLVVGRWDITAGNDTLSVWVDPANLGNIGAPVFTSSLADLGASGLTRLGFMAYGTGNGNVDAIRFSDTATAFVDVTGAPEPAMVVMLATLIPFLLLVARSRRRRNATSG